MSDPAMPCGALDLGDAEPSTVVNAEMAPLLAMSADFDEGGRSPFVMHYVCPENATGRAECTLTRTRLQGLAGGNAVLVTSAGNYVVATDQESRTLLRYSVHPQEGVHRIGTLSIGTDSPVRLVASLRNSDWVIARNLEGELLRYHPMDSAASRIAPDHDTMMLAAIGEQHVVGRIVLGEDQEELYLIPVDSQLSYLHRDPIRLGARDRIASRIVIGPGDLSVSVTYGTGDSAETKVFQIPDGALSQRFMGELVSGRTDLEELPGMRAISPDGSHLAYRTPKGSLALRDVENASSCVVQSATREETRVAGFSASGVLYFETAAGPGRTSVNAWVPDLLRRVELSHLDEGYTLTAVPAREGDDARTPWAVGLDHGTLVALQDTQRPQSLGLGDAIFLPRDDAALWVLNTKDHRSTREIALKRVEPRWSDQMRALAFDEPEDPKYRQTVPRGPQRTPPTGEDMYEPKQLYLRLDNGKRACMSAATPGAWAYACSSSDDRNFLAAGPPSSEDPFGGPRPEPEVPTSDAPISCGDGTPFNQATFYCYEYKGCCYRQVETACNIAGCVDGCAQIDETEHGVTIACANPSGGPN